MPGPLPKEQRRRRNAPAIPTTSLPAGGRTDPAPDIPVGVELGVTGLAWWEWAWRTPQAAGWASGHEAAVARRASLEDDLAALRDVEGLDLLDIVDEKWPAIRSAVQCVAALATGKLAILREMDALDDRLGLTPKSMAALRWSIKADEPAADAPAADEDGTLAAVHALHAVS